MKVTKTKFDYILETIDSIRISKYIDDDIFDISERMGVIDAAFKSALINAKISLAWEDGKKFRVNVKLSDNIWYMIPEDIQKIIQDGFTIGVFDHVLANVYDREDFGRQNTKLYIKRIKFYMIDIYYTAVSYIKRNISSAKVINNNLPKHDNSLFETFRKELTKKFSMNYTEIPIQPSTVGINKKVSLPFDLHTTYTPGYYSTATTATAYNENIPIVDNTRIRSDKDLAEIITEKEIVNAANSLMRLQFSENKEKNLRILKTISKMQALFGLQPVENGLVAMVFGLVSDDMESILLPDLESIAFIKVTVGENMVNFITKTASKDLATDMSLENIYSIAYKNRGGILNQIFNQFSNKIKEGNCPTNVKMSEFIYTDQDRMEIVSNLKNFFSDEPGDKWIPV